MRRKTLLQLVLLLAVFAPTCPAQEGPLFVTYSHHMEEPGNLDVETSATSGIPRSGQRFYVAPYLELEYGVTAQSTSEIYIEADSSWASTTVFTGWLVAKLYES